MKPNETETAKQNHTTAKAISFSKPEVPKLVEQTKNGMEFVLNGRNHSFVKFLTELYNKSATHKALINTKSDMIAGHTVTFEEGDDAVKEKASLFFEQVNENGETLHDILKKCALDYAIYGYAFIQVIWSNSKESVAGLAHVDASAIACGKADETGTVTEFFFNNDWSNPRKGDPVRIPAFNRNKPGKRQLLMIRNYEPGLVYYCNPAYDRSTMNYALMEFDLSEFHLSNLNHGFFPSAIISHFNLATEDEQDRIVEAFEDIYTGTKGKKIMHLWAENREMAPKIDTFQLNNLDTLFAALNTIAREQIVIGHRIMNKQLAGISQEGSLGDKNIIQDSFQLLHSEVIRPAQQLFESALNKILSVNFPKIKIRINTASPVSFEFSENILSQILTQDELRAKIGYAPLDPGTPTNLDTVRNANPDLNNGQTVYPNSILEQDQANIN